MALFFRMALGVCVGYCGWIGSILSQDYPNKPIRFVIPQAPGSVADTLARILSPEMSKSLGQPIVVENKTGAGNIIAYEYVARQAPADGYTLLSVLVSDLAILPWTAKDLRFDPLKDFPPIIGYAEGRLTLSSSPKLPWKTFNEMIATAKSNPGRYNYGAPNSLLRLSSEALIRNFGVNVVHIPYSSGTAYRQALLTEDVHLGFLDEGSAIALGDKLRVLAITGDKRSAAFKDVPTFAELGQPTLSGISYSINVRAGTPSVVFDKVYAAGSKALQQSDVKAYFAKIQLGIVEQTPEVAAKRLAQDAANFAEIAKKIGLQPQ